MSEVLTCVIIDDHPAIRAGLRLRLESDGVARVVGEADSGSSGLDLLLATRPDVAVVDMRLPDLTGLDVAEQARKAGVMTPLVMLTVVVERHVIEAALAIGIEAFVSKGSPLDVLVDALRAVSRGGRYVDPTLAPMLLAPADDRLTGRELDILRHMGEGLQNKVIAYRLSLSEETVKSHVSAILRKMNAASRTEAVVQGMRSSLIS